MAGTYKTPVSVFEKSGRLHAGDGYLSEPNKRLEAYYLE